MPHTGDPVQIRIGMHSGPCVSRRARRGFRSMHMYVPEHVEALVHKELIRHADVSVRSPSATDVLR
jgi:hypothetical protein